LAQTISLTVQTISTLPATLQDFIAFQMQVLMSGTTPHQAQQVTPSPSRKQ